ncbi:MAG TPA: tripartite tricarboxylate transporter substrate binding protein [Xanthobacteraceae bacterium]|jgi:tripartite-type tricarboxylate transporter receptor subunit TctC|nr:tripartite tricarboxylate transporter substrate binding protein [Xanthobacteraceae bacterium]
MAHLRARIGALVAAAVLTAATAITAQAAEYPDRVIRVIVPSAAGGGTDLSFRRIEPKLSEILGGTIVIENHPGATGNIGAMMVAQAPPDGYTLLVVISSHVINPSIMKNVPYDVERDFVPISFTMSVPSMLVSSPTVPAKNLKELIAYIRSKPGELNFASAGVGSMPHLMMELFLNETGLKMQHIPYKAIAPGLNDVIGNHVTLIASNVLTSVPFVRSGQLRAYGVTGAQRSVVAPDIPTLAEAGVPGYAAVQWFGLAAPKGTPRPIIEKLHAAVVKALNDPEIKAALVRDGAEPMPSKTPEEFGAFMKSEGIKWQKVAKQAGLAK